MSELEKPNGDRRRQQQRPLWKKPAAVAAALLVVVALAVGLGVGLGVSLARHNGEANNDNKSSNSNNNTRHPTSMVRSSMWLPEVNTTWQIVLNNPLDISGDISPDVDAYDLDLYENPVATFDELHNRGKHVICYFSGGTYEDWRGDKDQFHPNDLGLPLPDWPGERWLRLSSPNVRKIMKERVRHAASKGCDAIDPDNMDGYNNTNGLGLKQSDSVSFIQFLRVEADRYNMSLGLKNAGEIVQDVLNITDFCVNESCSLKPECPLFAPYIQQGKPVFRIEYPANVPNINPAEAKKMCESPGSQGFSTLLKPLQLVGWVQYCDGQIFNTTVIPLTQEERLQRNRDG
ncbi:Uncharacterized protein TCAP_04282 [Tolypocladium capitatum]|uniref:alpha-galactosidase n=1 Tax=Tolypocladium capitatum TaxID=45235 RepID=A0A2K3QE33_9HYPO|nr:Uncharacterized protein TCAP_04282 [Tolypocladium capitatum]